MLIALQHWTNFGQLSAGATVKWFFSFTMLIGLWQVNLPLTGIGWSPSGAAPTPTLVQGPFSSASDVTNQNALSSDGTGPTLVNCFRSNTQSGNTIVVMAISASAVSNMSVTDDGSSSNSYSIPSGAQETAGSHSIAIWTASVTHASRCVTLTFAATTNVDDNQIIMWEYKNLGTVDQTCAATATSGTAPACSAMTTTANGDLILAGVNVVSYGTKPTGSTHYTAQAGSWNLSLNDGTDWTGVQTEVQASSGAVTPAITTATAVTRANIVGVAFKATTSGSGPPAGPYLLSFQAQNNWGYSTAGTSTSQTFYFPCPTSVTGTTLWLLVGNIDSTTVSAVSDSNGNTWTGLTRMDSTGDGFSVQWYHTGLNPTCSGTENVTLTYGANPSTLVPLWNFFVVTGAASGYDSTASCSGTNVTGTGTCNMTATNSCASGTSCGGATITPSGYPAMVLSYQNQDFDTASGANVGQFLTAVEICPNAGNVGCAGAGTSTNYMYVGSGLEQDAGIIADNLASGSAAITWSMQNTQNTNVGASFSSTIDIK